MIESLNHPEYLHVLINPLPVYGLAIGTLALAVSLLLRRRQAQLLALWLVLASAASAWPTYFFGQRAYHQVYLIADSDGQSWLDVHMHRAEKWIYVFYALAATTLAALLLPIKLPKTALPLAILSLILALGALGVGGWIAYAGGKVRHSEFRSGTTAPASEHSHEK